jgi:hemerythrin superfamily protein
MENVLDVIKRDHDEAAELFSEVRRYLIEETLSETEVRASFQKLEQALISHLSAEEEAVYACLKEREETRDYAFEGAAEHGVAVELIEKLANAPVVDEAWRAEFFLLKKEVEGHVETEELEIFPLVRETFTRAELEAMAEDMLALKAVVQETAFIPAAGLRSAEGMRGARPDSEIASDR